MKTGIKDEMKESQSKRNNLLEKEKQERFSKLSDWKVNNVCTCTVHVYYTTGSNKCHQDRTLNYMYMAKQYKL